jgi:hypothetical protein
MCVPLYNAEMSPPEVRGSLVALQQFAIGELLLSVAFSLLTRSAVQLRVLWFHSGSIMAQIISVELDPLNPKLRGGSRSLSNSFRMSF